MKIDDIVLMNELLKFGLKIQARFQKRANLTIGQYCRSECFWNSVTFPLTPKKGEGTLQKKKSIIFK